jgi:hypothetical protein
MELPLRRGRLRAALASGTTTLAGGFRHWRLGPNPAAYNGVIGLKPPYSRVPQAAPFNLDVYCHCGPMARTAADCALFEKVLAGPHPHDHVSLRPNVEIPAEFEPATRHSGLRPETSREAMDHSEPVTALSILQTVESGDERLSSWTRESSARRRYRGANRRCERRTEALSSGSGAQAVSRSSTRRGLASHTSSSRCRTLRPKGRRPAQLV